VLAYLADQDVALRDGERALLAGDPSAVHGSRVGARRARSTLRTFADLFEPEPRTRLEESLREYAGRMGQVRDLQVLRTVLTGEAEGALADWIDSELAGQLRAAWLRLERDLEGPDPHRVTDDLSVVALAPGAKDVDVRGCVKKARRKAERKLARAGEDAERLHDARKAAKRARYAAEATSRQKQALRFKQLQDRLGAHHDLVVAASWLEQADVPPPLRADAVALGVHLRADGERARRAAVL
jgi:CHAD domain-containing protein